MRCSSRLGLLLVVAVAGSLAAQEQGNEKLLEPKPQSVERAKFVDFNGKLGLGLASLETIGEQIDQARLDADPVKLAHAAALLRVVEQASGKTAKIHSKSIAAESTELAMTRGNPTELRVVAGLVGGADAKKMIAQADKIQEAEEAGETSKELEGRLIVDNHSHSDVYVYADGRFLGHVHAHQQGVFNCVDAHHSVEARDSLGHRWVGDVHYGHYHTYRFVLYPPHHH